jgi:hypothetical protein
VAVRTKYRDSSTPLRSGRNDASKRGSAPVGMTLHEVAKGLDFEDEVFFAWGVMRRRVVRQRW